MNTTAAKDATQAVTHICTTFTPARVPTTTVTSGFLYALRCVVCGRAKGAQL